MFQLHFQNDFVSQVSQGIPFTFYVPHVAHILWKCTFCLVSPGIGPRGQILMNILPSHLSDQHLSAYNNGLKTKGNFKYQVDHFRETDVQHLKSPQIPQSDLPRSIDRNHSFFILTINNIYKPITL